MRTIEMIQKDTQNILRIWTYRLAAYMNFEKCALVRRRAHELNFSSAFQAPCESLDVLAAGEVLVHLFRRVYLYQRQTPSTLVNTNPGLGILHLP